MHASGPEPSKGSMGGGHARGKRSVMMQPLQYLHGLGSRRSTRVQHLAVSSKPHAQNFQASDLKCARKPV